MKNERGDMLITVAGILIVLGIALAFIGHCNLMSECMADGHKHYECSAMINGGYHYTYPH